MSATEEIDLYGEPSNANHFATPRLLTISTEILGVEKSAGKDEIRKAYRKVCRPLFHITLILTNVLHLRTRL